MTPTGRNGETEMREDELTLGDAMGYFNDGELNPREELLHDLSCYSRYIESTSTDSAIQSIESTRGNGVPKYT